MSADVTAPPSGERTSEQQIARLFGLTGDAWMRHANPISGGGIHRDDLAADVGVRLRRRTGGMPVHPDGQKPARHLVESAAESLQRGELDQGDRQQPGPRPREDDWPCTGLPVRREQNGADRHVVHGDHPRHPPTVHRRNHPADEAPLEQSPDIRRLDDRDDGVDDEYTCQPGDQHEFEQLRMTRGSSNRRRCVPGIRRRHVGRMKSHRIHHYATHGVVGSRGKRRPEPAGSPR